MCKMQCVRCNVEDVMCKMQCGRCTVGGNGGRNSLSMIFPLLQGQKSPKLVLGGDMASFRLALTEQSYLPPK